MRIIAGRWGGRGIDQPRTKAVRPLGDKVRGALFNAIGPIEGLMMLDAYAGSGAAGLEALSRGALSVEAVESDKRTAAVIQSNARSLGASEAFVLWQLSVENWLKQPENSQPRFNLVIADPPYAKLDAAVIDQLGKLLLPGGRLVLSHSSKLAAPELKSVSLTQTKTYGDSSLSFYLRR